MNDHDLREGGRLFSAYDTPAGRSHGSTGSRWYGASGCSQLCLQRFAMILEHGPMGDVTACLEASSHFVAER